jgi:SAM-dependent methyltransferase
MRCPRYENYNDTSKTYDNWRKPISIEDYLFSLGKAAQRLGKNVDECARVPPKFLTTPGGGAMNGCARRILLLEAGCGTGNYMEALAPHVGECVGVEFSEGMLKQVPVARPAPSRRGVSPRAGHGRRLRRSSRTPETSRSSRWPPRVREGPSCRQSLGVASVRFHNGPLRFNPCG